MKLILTVIVTVSPIAVGPWGQANFDGQDPDSGKSFLKPLPSSKNLFRNENGIHWLRSSCSRKSIR